MGLRASWRAPSSENQTPQPWTALALLTVRRSAELAWNRRAVRTQDMNQSMHYQVDAWKHHVVDEAFDCRVNYAFTVKCKFGDSLKPQELNYENIPTTEASESFQKSQDVNMVARR
jgi:hypothetical protein